MSSAGMRAHRCFNRSSTVLACIAACLLIGCSTERNRARTVTTPRVHSTFNIDAEQTDGPSLRVRDLFTQELFTVDVRDTFVVLSTSNGIIDTMSLPALVSRPRSGGTRTFSLEAEKDSSFVSIRVINALGRTLFTDVVCIANAELMWAATLVGSPQIPDSGNDAQYRTSHTLLDSPLSIRGTEMYTRVGFVPMSWSHSFELSFDDSARVFANRKVVLDSVPFETGSRVVTGEYPAIVLRIGTTAFVEGAWYALTVPGELDPVELEKGTVGVAIDGDGEWGDTLRAVGR